MSNYARAFRSLEVSVPQYFLRTVAPLVGGSLAFGLVIFFGLRTLLSPVMIMVLPILFLAFGIGTAVVYPVAQADRRKNQINHAVPFFMTHLGVLATSNLPRPEIFRILGERKEYGALAAEMRKIHSLTVHWNMALPQACRFVSLTTPSQILGDFLDRLAQALETGQDLESFLRNEQHVVMKEFATVYETSMYQVESLKDMYTSLIMSGVFFAIFAIITPIITQTSSTQLLVAVVCLFAFIEFVLLFLLRARVPDDKLWHNLPIGSPERERILQLVGAGLIGSFALVAVLVALDIFPVAITIAMSVTPMAGAGFYAHSAEARIRRREDNYGAFIRSVGSAAEARGGSLREVLKKVRTHNFGPLTLVVQNLFSRLTWRLHDVLAWRHFSAESGSKLVSRFNEMFVEGIRAGGKPGVVGSLISENILRILNLRRARYSAAGTFRGLLIGLTASMSFTLFIGLGILQVLGGLFKDAPSSDVNPVNVEVGANTDLVRALLIGVVLVHALVAAFMIKTVDGGGYAAGLLVFVIFVWIGLGLGSASEVVIRSVFKGTGS